MPIFQMRKLRPRLGLTHRTTGVNYCLSEQLIHWEPALVWQETRSAKEPLKGLGQAPRCPGPVPPEIPGSLHLLSCSLLFPLAYVVLGGQLSASQTRIAGQAAWGQTQSQQRGGHMLVPAEAGRDHPSWQKNSRFYPKGQ